jgi:hypothetical protein
VGADGARAAWLIVQHAIGRPALQRDAARSVGLGPLADAVRAQRRAAAAEGERAPADWHARRRQMETWLRETGWRR